MQKKDENLCFFMNNKGLLVVSEATCQDADAYFRDGFKHVCTGCQSSSRRTDVVYQQDVFAFKLLVMPQVEHVADVLLSVLTA